MKKKDIKSIDDLYRNPILFDITIIACMSVLVAFLIKEFEVKEP